jgi:hypothetical protein
VDTSPPKAFVSHATKDKDRFVLEFASRLRAQGIDAWVDQWEMAPGDSLVDKIFEEGIKNAHAFIVVLSENSVDRKWVREELNVGLVRKIEGLMKLIPVIIDDCEVPEALRSTVWVKIDDLDSYEEKLQDIVDAIFRRRDKPALGVPPAYATLADALPGLTAVDTAVLKAACARTIRKGGAHVQTDEVLETLESLSIGREQVMESLELLARRHYIDAKKFAGGQNEIPLFRVTVHGFEQYARQYVEGYDRIVRDVGLEIVNRGATNNRQIAPAIGQPEVLVNHVLEVLRGRGLFDLTAAAAGGLLLYIRNVSPELKRLLA